MVNELYINTSLIFNALTNPEMFLLNMYAFLLILYLNIGLYIN